MSLPWHLELTWQILAHLWPVSLAVLLILAAVSFFSWRTKRQISKSELLVLAVAYLFPASIFIWGLFEAPVPPPGPVDFKAAPSLWPCAFLGALLLAAFSYFGFVFQRAASCRRLAAAAILCSAWLTLCTAAALAYPRLNPVVLARLAAKGRATNRFPKEVIDALRHDPNLILYSINPDLPRGQAAPGAPLLHDYKIIGQLTISDAAQRERLVETLLHGMNVWNGLTQFACGFDPHHALRATDGKNSYDVLICFKCGDTYYYPPKGEPQHFFIYAKPGPFDELLDASKVPRWKPRSP